MQDRAAGMVDPCSADLISRPGRHLARSRYHLHGQSLLLGQDGCDRCWELCIATKQGNEASAIVFCSAARRLPIRRAARDV